MLFEINHLKLVLTIIKFKSIDAAPYFYCLLLKSAVVKHLKAVVFHITKYYYPHTYLPHYYSPILLYKQY